MKTGYRIGKKIGYEKSLGDLKVALCYYLQEVRKERGVTQRQLAELVNSSQPRIAMIENGSSSVTIDLILKALFALGAKGDDISKVVRSI